MAKEVFGNLWVAQNPAVVGAPAPGTIETWNGMVQALGVIPVLAAGEQLRVVENDDIRQGEIILVTATAGGNWTVVRGAEGTTPQAHPANASYVQIVTSAQLAGFQTKTIRVPHTWQITGQVQLASGDTSYIPPFYVPVPAGQSVIVAGVRCKARSAGATFNVGLYKNGGAQTSGIPVTTSPASPAVNPTSFANLDEFALIVESLGGGAAPFNMTFTVFLDYTVGV